MLGTPADLTHVQQEERSQMEGSGLCGQVAPVMMNNGESECPMPSYLSCTPG